jgi:hypothetical protein
VKRKQLQLPVKMFRVRCDGFVDVEVQAATAPAAKYQVFKKAREAGYFADPRSAFRDFIARGFTAREIRR